MIDQVMKTSENTNCQDDLDEFMLNLASPTSHPDVPVDDAEAPPLVDFLQSLPQSVRSLITLCTIPELSERDMSSKEENVSAYVAGYIAKQVKGKVCEECHVKLCGQICGKDSHQFLRLKQYEEAARGLQGPSEELEELVSACETQYQKNIDSIVSGKNVKHLLYNCITKDRDIAWITCQRCKAHKVVIHMWINIRLSHTLKLANREMAEPNQGQNRKSLKFQHM